MVLCQYFINNNCRFGSKCNNEHLDVRATIKQEMEAAIKGRQWPLSVFGPFKEKPNLIPNEYDLSFEEVRFQFLEARASNNFAMYEQQLMHKIQEANARMQSLLNVNKDVLQMAVNIYNDNSNTGAGNAAGGNATGLFGNNAASTSVFGGNANAKSSIFGAAAANSTQNNSSSLFGNSNHLTQNSASSIFGGGSQSTGTFGMNSTQSSSIFGTNNPSVSLFGPSNTMQADSSSIFGQSSTFGSQQQQQQQSIFSKANVTPTFGSSAFGSGSATPSGFFSSAANSTFGSQNHQSGTAQNAIAFGMQPTTQPTFGQPALLPTSSFGGSSSPFASQLQHSVSQPVTATSSLFGNLGQQASQAALATFTNQITTQPQTLQASPFGITSNTSVFGSSVPTSMVQTPVLDPTVYSKMEELTPEQLAAFQANEFILGTIPSVPPPIELARF